MDSNAPLEQAVITETPEKVSSQAKWIAILSLLFVLSTSASYRINIGGLLVHIYLMLIPLALSLGKIKLKNMPVKSYNYLLYFLMFYSFASIQNPNPLSEPFKVGASVLTFLIFAQAVHSEKDFEVVSYGFILCAIYVAFKALGKAESGDVSRLAGVNALEGLGNKNAQSLYTLPGLFILAILLLRSYEQKKIIRMALYSGGIFLLLIGLVLSANRSGWVGAGVIFAFIVARMGISVKTMLIGVMVVLMGYFAVVNFASDIVEHKVNKTTEGYSSDEKREKLLLESMLVGLEHPIMGLGNEGLYRELSRRLKAEQERLDPHNLYGLLAGGGGLFTFTFFFMFLFSLFRPINYYGRKTLAYLNYRNAQILMFGFIVLYCVRAIFTREILYNPNFMGALGLFYSYLLYWTKILINEQSNTTEEEV